MKNVRLFGKKTGKGLIIFSALILLNVFITPSATPAANQVRMAIFNFVALSMEASGYGTAATNMLGDSLKAHPSNSVMDRKDLEAFLYLNDYQQDDRIENAVSVGTRLGVNAVIVGNVQKKGTWIIVNCQVVLIEQKKIILNTRVGAQGEAGLSVEIRKLAGQINEAFDKYALTASDEPLKAPVNIQIRSGNRQIYVSWEDPADTNADGYDIFRSHSKEGPFAKIGQVQQREYLDKDLERSTAYHYRIKSFTHTGRQSGFTDIITGEAVLTPNPPVILRAESLVKGVQLTWAPSPIASEDPLILMGYKLFRADSEKGPFREAADLTRNDLDASANTSLDKALRVTSKGVSNLTGANLGISGNRPIEKASRVTYVDTNLKDGQEAYYRLTVYNEKKIESGFSSTIKGAAIPVVSGLTAQGGLVREIRLVWNAIDASYLRGYDIYRSTKENGDFVRIRKLEKSGEGESEVRYTDRDALGDNLRYYYRVSAYDDTDQQTAPSAVVSAVTKPRPVRPAGLKGEPLKVKAVPLSWQANPEKDVVAYHVHRREGTDGRFSAVAKVPGGETRHQDKELKDGVAYGYKIQAEDKGGILSDFSEEIHVSTKPRPKSPAGLTGHYRNGSVELAWRPNDASDIAYYKVYEKTFWRIEAVAGLDQIVTHSVTFNAKLGKGDIKTYLVTAVDRDGLESDHSPEMIVMGH
jgi:hypothetical protein